jgi:hypothetical protein
VKLPDGFYTLTASIKNTGCFSKLEMYAASAGKRIANKVKRATPQWTTLTLKRVPVRNGKIEVGFRADGSAGASCQVDDISLVREK